MTKQDRQYKLHILDDLQNLAIDLKSAATQNIMPILILWSITHKEWLATNTQGNKIKKR